MISPSSTNPAVTETGDYIFRACFTDILGKILANFASQKLQAKDRRVHRREKRLQQRTGKILQEHFTAAGGQIVAELDFNGGDKDFKAQITAIKAANPEAVFIPAYYTDVALICIRQAAWRDRPHLRWRRLGERRPRQDRQGCGGRHLFPPIARPIRPATRFLTSWPPTGKSSTAKLPMPWRCSVMTR